MWKVQPEHQFKLKTIFIKLNSVSAFYWKSRRRNIEMEWILSGCVRWLRKLGFASRRRALQEKNKIRRGTEEYTVEKPCSLLRVSPLSHCLPFPFFKGRFMFIKPITNSLKLCCRDVFEVETVEANFLFSILLYIFQTSLWLYSICWQGTRFHYFFVCSNFVLNFLLRTQTRGILSLVWNFY